MTDGIATDFLECLGSSLDGLAFLGLPGGAAYVDAVTRGLAVAEGVAPDGSEATLLRFWDDSLAIAAVDAAGRPSLRCFGEPEAAWAEWSGTA